MEWIEQDGLKHKAPKRIWLCHSDYIFYRNLGK